MNLIESFEKVDTDLSVHLRDATGDLAFHEKQPILIWVMSTENKEFKRIDSEISNRLDNAKNPNSDLKEKLGLEKMAKVTTKIENLYYPGEEDPIEYSFSDALKLYKTCPDILMQVVDFYKNRDNFLASRLNN